MAGILCAGSYVCDFIAAGLNHIPGPGELVYAPYGIELRAGGHSANVAVDLAQLGSRRIASAGCVGDDLLGGFIEAELRRSGVAVYPEVTPYANTAKNLALVIEGEDRRFVAELTANTMLSTRYLLTIIEDVRPEFFYLGTVGGLRFIDEDLVQVLRYAKDLGCLTMVDVVMPSGFGWANLTGALPLVDILHCNGLECSALTGLRDPASSAGILLRDGVKLVLVTFGAEGVYAASEGFRLRMPAFKVEPVDPTGAGDAFCAGVIHKLLESSEGAPSLKPISRDLVVRALLEGEAAGASCVSSLGATIGVTRESVDRLLEAQGETVLDGVSFEG
ncbi:MAG: carbohydrate kinase family protein [Candidatus Bathyarchaeia archaeon]